MIRDSGKPPTRQPWRGGGAIAIAVMTMNVATYLFTLVAARLLGPSPYGAFAAVMNVLLVASVLALALQATAARRIAREPGDVHTVEAAILLVGRRSALGLGAVFLMLAPLIDQMLRLDSLTAAALLAVAVAPTTMMGAQAGVLQGERRWLPLALMYLAAGVPRLLIGTAALVARPTEEIAVLGVAIAAFAPVAVGGAALRRIGAGRAPAGERSAGHSPRALWWETVYNSQALLAFLVLSNVDIVLARHALDHEQAGLYAGGLIMVKAVLFLPQFVVVLAFPSMGTDTARRPALLGSLALVAVIGSGVVAAAWALSGIALLFVGGDEYGAIQDDLWLFALLGTLLSMLQLLVYSVLARRARNSVALLWLGLAALVGVGLGADSITGLAARVAAVDTALLGLLFAVSMWRLAIPAPDEAAQPARS